LRRPETALPGFGETFKLLCDQNLHGVAVFNSPA
jgi:hypothetical protein